MPCTDPRTVGFQADGKTISWSKKNFSKEYATFQLPCGQCLECRLNYAREWSIRCVHEAQMHPENSFITLTYDNEHLKSPKLVYEDFQKFMKRLRRTYPNNTIGCFVTGEYGDKTKRPHWHALIFGWYPRDATYFRSNDLGDKIYTSKSLDKIWGHGNTELGSVTYRSAGYCARYAAKKLAHGKDGEHEYEPISKKSSKNAIGKKWLERYFWSDCFAKGYIVHENQKLPIPRYYEKWLREKEPALWRRYVTEIKIPNNLKHAERAELEKAQYFDYVFSRPLHKPNPLSPNQRRAAIQQAKFTQLQDQLKL